MKNTYLKSLGSRIMCELNDLKRTPEAAAKDLGFNNDVVKQILKGSTSKNEALEFIDKMGQVYPIDASELKLIEDDTDNGARFMRIADSRDTSRVYQRVDKRGQMTDYYEYWDTVMSNVSYFKPELIQQLRVVENNDPENPGVRYNHGHFLHQYGIFVGEVNFYYEINGKKHCEVLNTGDSYYMTPFIPHTFTSRNPDKLGYMIAVTSGGEVKRAQKELYALGERALDGYSFEGINKSQSFSKLIRQHLANEMLTAEIFEERLRKSNVGIQAVDLLNGIIPSNFDDLKAIANALNIRVDDLILPHFDEHHIASVRRYTETTLHAFPSKEKRQYAIYPLVRSPKMLSIKGFIIEVIGKNLHEHEPLESAMHAYIINFGNTPVAFRWEYDGQQYHEVLNHHDSVYLKPFTPYSFASENGGNVFVVYIQGAITLSTQKEMMGFHEPMRIIKELKPWFN